MQNILLIISTLLLLTVTACDSSPTTQKKQHQAKVKERVTLQQYEWPPADDNIPLAKDFLAKNYYVVFDCSGSMADKQCSGHLNKLDAAKVALKEFANIVPVNANLGLLVFENNNITELVPLGTQNRDKFISAVQSTTAEGSTPLRDAITMAYRKLETQGTSQLGYGEYNLVVVTDGVANEGQDPTRIVEHTIDSTPIQIHTIGFCIGTNHSLNIPGRTVYKAADNPTELQRGLQDVLAESETFDASDFKL